MLGWTVSRHKCGPRRARTVDPRIKSPLLYQLSYRPHCALVLSLPASSTQSRGAIVSEIRDWFGPYNSPIKWIIATSSRGSHSTHQSYRESLTGVFQICFLAFVINISDRASAESPLSQIKSMALQTAFNNRVSEPCSSPLRIISTSTL